MNKTEAATPFNANELMELLRGLKRREIEYQIEYRPTTESCDGITVRILSCPQVWEVGFFDSDHIEVLKFTLSGDVETGVTAASLLSDLDALVNPQ